MLTPVSFAHFRSIYIAISNGKIQNRVRLLFPSIFYSAFERSGSHIITCIHFWEILVQHKVRLVKTLQVYFLKWSFSSTDIRGTGTASTKPRTPEDAVSPVPQSLTHPIGNLAATAERQSLCASYRLAGSRHTCYRLLIQYGQKFAISVWCQHVLYRVPYRWGPFEQRRTRALDHTKKREEKERQEENGNMVSN